MNRDLYALYLLLLKYNWRVTRYETGYDDSLVVWVEKTSNTPMPAWKGFYIRSDVMHDRFVKLEPR